MNVAIDPGVVTLIQSIFLDNLNSAFGVTAHYAIRLLYLLAAIEFAIFGLIWMLQREAGWDKLFFKIIKIGLIFFIIQNFTWLLDIILSSFTKLAGAVINNTKIADYVFNPAKIWEFGYNIGIHLLQIASQSSLFGLSLIVVSLGIGILLVFGLIGILLVIQVVSFYVVCFSSLILMPFGALSTSRNMFDKSVQAVLKSGLRLMCLIIIIGVAVATWSQFDFNNLVSTTNFNLNEPLGLFFSALLFLGLAIYLPKVVSEAVGDVSSNILEGSTTVVTTTHEAASPFVSATYSSLPNIQAATTIAPGVGGGPSYGGTTSVSAASTVPPTVITSTGSQGLEARLTRDSLAQASTMAKSISESTVKKIKEDVIQAIKETKTKE